MKLEFVYIKNIILLMYILGITMKTLFINIKNLIPYLLIILIYFFFVNLEVKKKELNNKLKNETNIEKIKEFDENKNTDIRISIPVIPYEAK